MAIKLNQRKRNIIKWILYSLVVFLLYILQTTVGFLRFFGVKPIFVLPIVVFVAMFEGEWSSAFFAVLTGLFWDVAADKLLGFHAAILLILAVCIALLSMYLIRASFWNSMLVMLGAAVFYGLCDYFFCYFIWGLPGNHIILLKSILPTVFYTTLIAPPFFFLVRRIARTFQEE